MIEDKLQLISELENNKNNIEVQKTILKREVDKFRFSTDENVVNKTNELNAILDDPDIDSDARLQKFLNGAKTLVTYLSKYDNVLTVEEADWVKELEKNCSDKPSFLYYPDNMKIKPVMRNQYFSCLAAPTGVGKTRFILNMMYQYYLQKKVCYFFSFEMTEIEIITNLIAIDIYYKSIDKISGEAKNILTREQVEEDYANSTDIRKKVYKDKAESMKQYIRILKVQKNTPKNVYFAQTYKQHEHGEIPAIVFIDHFHYMSSDKEISYENAVSRFADIAHDLSSYAKISGTVYFILGQMDNKEKEAPKYYEESGWKYTGDFATYAQHYWKLFRDPNEPGQWLLYNAKLRNATMIFEPYQIKFCPQNGAIISSKNEAIR